MIPQATHPSGSAKAAHLEIHLPDLVDVRGGRDDVLGEAASSADPECLKAHAVVAHPALAVMARAAGDDRIERHGVALYNIQYARANLIDDPGDFVTGDQRVKRIEMPTVQVQIRAANAGRGDFNPDLARAGL